MWLDGKVVVIEVCPWIASYVSQTKQAAVGLGGIGRQEGVDAVALPGAVW